MDAWRACYGSDRRIRPSQAIAISRGLVRDRRAVGKRAARGLRLHHYLFPFSRIFRNGRG
jgi:hypothetical protein